MREERITNLYIAGVLAAGLVCVIAAIMWLPVEVFDLKFVLLAGMTIAIGSRSTIRIPRFKSHIAVSDTFIFLVLLLYGGEYAILLSAVEAFASSWRFCNRRITVFFNAATMAVSTSSVVIALKLLGLYSSRQLHGGAAANGTSFVFAVTVIVLTQFAVNTSLAAIYDSLKSKVPVWEIWKTKYVWAFLTYFVGIGGAAVLYQLSDMIGFGILAATFPLIFFIYLSYRMYLKNVEISIQQAEQAEQYAQILESKSDALRASEERFRSAFEHAPIGIALVSPKGEWLRVNHALSDILGYTEAELLATNFQSLTVAEDLEITIAKIEDLFARQFASFQMEQRYRHKSGNVVWTSFSVSTAGESPTGEPNLIFQIQDITHKKFSDQELEHRATHDVLTGLPNRALFMKRLSDALETKRHVEGYNVSVLFIDLDRFKYVNDSLGHMVGDELLRGIARRLCECMRPSDIVARLGGDEFTILVEGGYDLSEVTRISERIQSKFSVPFDLSGHDVYTSASIGILHSSENHSTSEEVMRDADTAMYQAKKAGKARHEVFDENMHKNAKEVLRLETDLRRAVERDEISVEYQPIYSLASGEIEGVEALARWHHPQLGNISPSKFVPLAEEIGLIDKLCDHVLRRSCHEIGSLKGVIDPGLRLSLSINLSCKQFAQASLVSRIQDVLTDTSFSASDLRLEITESVFFEHADRAVKMLHRLRDMGIGIDIDDFGTGYSNLGYLIQLPISKLKVDRSFVAMMSPDGGNDEIVRAIVTLARNLGLSVVAEGIENEPQSEKLKALGCESGQGYLFAAPMPFEEFRKFVVSEWHADMPLATSGELLLETVQ